MRRAIGIGAKDCCTKEKARLMEALFECDYCTESLEDRHLCYRKAASESGKRARYCILAAK